MSIRKKELANDVWMVSASGRLDQALTPQLEETLDQVLTAGHTRLIVNLSEASYINSGGLRALVSAWRKARQKGGDLVLCGLNARLQEIFTLVGFDKVFQIYSNCNSVPAFEKA